MRELAIEVLARHGVPELSAHARTAAVELATLERELDEIEGRCPWWERAIFKRGRDPERAAALEHLIARGRAERDRLGALAEQALTAASEELLPLEIAVATERLIARVVADAAVGRVRCDAHETIANALEALADRVAAIWVPGFDAERVAAQVARACEAVVRPTSLPAAVRDERLGFRPIDEHELVQRAAEALFGTAYERARATLAREAAEHAAAASALARARQELGLVDAMLPGKSAHEHTIAQLSQALTREHQELVAASETVFALVDRAIAAFAPMAIYAAASAAAGVLRAAVYTTEPGLFEHGVRMQPSGAPRAVLLYALFELRQCVERAFPGLPALVSGRGGERDARALSRAARGDARGPYRERSPEPEAEEQPLGSRDALRRLHGAIERSSAPALLRQTLAHAAMLGGIERALRRTESRIDWADRLAFWSPSDESLLLERLSRRRDWHRTMAHALVAELANSVNRAALVMPLYRLRDALHNAHYALASIASQSGTVTRSTVCQVFHRQPALNGLSAVAHELGRTWALGGDRTRLAHDVSRRITGVTSGPPPVDTSSALRALSYEELVSTLAAALGKSAFAGIEARLWHAHHQYQQAIAATRAAEREVTLWDQINIFTDSEAERARDEWEARARGIAVQAQADFAQADQLLEQAIAFYPPAALYYRIGALAAAVHAIRAQRRNAGSSKHPRYVCVLVGQDRAQQALSAWTAGAIGVFGAMASNGDLLEWFVASELGSDAITSRVDKDR